MPSVAQKLFRLAPGEGYRIGRFALLGLLLQAGLAFGTSAADALFLVKVGADKLPHIYILTPVMMLCYIPAYSALLSRWGIDRVFDATLGLLAACGVALWLLCAHFHGAEPIALCYAAKLYAALWYVGLYTLFWNFLDGYFDLVDAKRLFSFCFAGGALGSIIGGSLVDVISAHFGVGALFLAWAVCSVVAVPVVISIRRRTHKLDADDADSDDAPALAEAAAAVRQMAGSRYAIVLTALLFFTLLTATVCEYQYMGIFAEGLDEATLASFLGRLTAMVNIVNLAISLFFFNQLVARFGVRNVALLQPVAYAVVFTALLLNGDYASAAVGFFAFQGLMIAIEFNNVNLMFAGLPTAGRKQIRTLIEGLCEPLATASAGFFLLFAASSAGSDDLPLLSPEQLSMAGIALALSCLVLVLILRHDYAIAIADNLRGAWLDFTRPTAPLLARTTPADLDLAESRALAEDGPVAALALRVLHLKDADRLNRTLPVFLREASAEAHRHALPVFEAIVTQRDSSAARALVEWHRTRPPGTDIELDALLARQGLGPTGDVTQSAALRHIDTCLAAGDEPSVLQGLRALGGLHDARQAFRLRHYLRSHLPAVRSEALIALDRLADGTSRVLIPDLVSTLLVGSTADRARAIRIFERIGDTGALSSLLAGAGSFTPSERRQTEQMIARFGSRTVPTLIAVSQSPAYAATARSVALRALGRLSLPQAQMLAGPLVEQTTRKAYSVLSGAMSLAAQGDEPGQTVLRRIYRDYPLLISSVVLETLAVAGRLPNFESVLAGLDSSQSKERGYALESVEQACTRETFTLLLPLIDRRSVEAQIEFGRSRGLIANATTAQVLARALASDFPLEASAAAQASHALDPAGSAEALLAKLRSMRSPMLRKTVFTLLARRAGHTALASALTPVEHVNALLSFPSLSYALLTHLEFMGAQLRLATPPAGTVLCRRGEPLPGIWFVRAGSVRAADGTALEPGGVVGAEALHGALLAPCTYSAGERCETLFLPSAVIRRCVEIFPEFGVALLAHAPDA